MDWVYTGRCWKFGDNLAVDADLTKKEFAMQRETRPEVLREFCMCGVDPDFPKKVGPHDIIVAGRRFAQGMVPESTTTAAAINILARSGVILSSQL